MNSYSIVLNFIRGTHESKGVEVIPNVQVRGGEGGAGGEGRGR